MPAIYTRTGDSGDTGLFGGSRVGKQSPRVEAYGTVDEANTAIGEAKAALRESSYADASTWYRHLQHIQQRMFVLGAELASDSKGLSSLGNKVSSNDIVDLEHLIEECLLTTGPPQAFVVPGSDGLSGRFHSARTVVRRAERRTLALAEHESVRPELVKYLNRLSDTIYAMARLTETWAETARVEAVVRTVVDEHFGARGPASPAEAHSTATSITMSLDLAQQLAASARSRADQIGVPMVIAVVDTSGNLVLLHRMPESLVASLELAPNKAWTANAFKNTTARVGELAVEDGPLRGLEGGNSGRVVLFGGGAPLVVADTTIGAIGISGGTVEEDVDVMNHAIETVFGAQK